MDKFYLNETNDKRKYKYDYDIIPPKKNENLKQLQLPKTIDSLIYTNKFNDLNKLNYTNDKYKIKEKGDKKLNEWIMKQTEPLIVFISDIIPETKVLPHLEKIRPIIKTTPLMSIEEYRKTKKIGEEGTIYLKKLKDKYGNIILKILWASINL